MRKLLIIAYAFPPFPAPGSARAWRFYKYLPEFGYEPYVITASQPDELRPRVRYVPVPAKDFSERVLRKFLFPTDDDMLWVRPAVAAAQRLLAETSMDAVLSTIPPINSHIVAYLLKRRFQLPWIADYRDPIVGNPFRTTTGLPGRIDRVADRRFFRTADLLLSVTEQSKISWLRTHPEANSKAAVLWNGFDPEEAIAPKPIPQRPYRVLAHFGSFYGGRNPVVPMASIARLIERGAVEPGNLRLRFVGPMDPAIETGHQQLFEQLRAAGCLELLPAMPRAAALELMMGSDQLLLADNNDLNMGHTVPAKLFEYVRVGRPILALTVAGSAVEHVLSISGLPFRTLSPGMEEQAIDARMLEFLNLPSEPVPVSEQFSSEFNGRNQAQILAKLIDDILARRNQSGNAPG